MKPKSIPIVEDSWQFPDVDAISMAESFPIFRLPAFLSSRECETIIDLARPKLVDSQVANSEKGKGVVKLEARVGKTAFLSESGKLPNEPVLCDLLKKVERLSGFSISHIEGIKVVHYSEGEYYNSHYDHFRQHSTFRQRAGERILSLFIYLNSLPKGAGGFTCFPKLDLRIQPIQGDGILWLNMDLDGNYFEDSLHAGEKIIGNYEKWGMNIWTHELPYNDTA